MSEREHGVYVLREVMTRNLVGFAHCACEASKMAREVAREWPDRELILGVEGCHGYRVIRRYNVEAGE